MIPSHHDSLVVSYLVTQPHHPTRGSYRDKSTRNESFDADLLRGLGQRNLILLLRGTNTTDDDIDLGQRFDEMLLGSLQIAFADMYPPILQLDDSGLGNRGGTDESDDLLFNKRTMLAPAHIQFVLVGSYKSAIFQQPICNGATGFARCTDQKHIGPRHDGGRCQRCE